MKATYKKRIAASVATVLASILFQATALSADPSPVADALDQAPPRPCEVGPDAQLTLGTRQKADAPISSLI